MKRFIFLITMLTLALVLAACSSKSGTQSSNESDSVANNSVSANGGSDSAPADSGNAATVSQAGDPVVLSEDFDGALPVQAQLALGTVQLETSELAVDQALAADLLPLWQAVQSLANSDTAAEAEMQAVINQIQGTMTPSQIAAIADMQLTEDSLTALVESGDLGFGAGGRGFAGRSGAEDGARGGLAGGGRPGGGLPGGGPGGGGPGAGGFAGGPGGGLGNLSEDDIATRQAQFAEGGAFVFQDRLLTGAVVRLLEDKTGVVSDRTLQANVFNDALTLVAETSGLTLEEIRSETGGGKSLASIVEENGGDLDSLQMSLTEIFSQLPNASELDLDQAVAQWLGIEP